MTHHSQASDDLDPGGEPSSSITLDDEQDVPVGLAFLRSLAARALEALAVPADAALAITLVGPDEMATLKEKALGEREPTDVLAFPMDDPADPMPGPFVVGDVVICPAVAAEQARAAGHSLNDELATLLVHGILFSNNGAVSLPANNHVSRATHDDDTGRECRNCQFRKFQPALPRIPLFTCLLDPRHQRLMFSVELQHASQINRADHIHIVQNEWCV